MRTPPSIARRSGFTLLEVVIAVGLLAVLVGLVFGIARSTLQLGNSIVTTQNEEMLRASFLELLDRRLGNLPGNTRMELAVTDDGNHYLSDLTLQDVPMSFTWGGEERIAKAVRLSTVKRRSGYLDIVLSYFENEVLEGSESAQGGVSSAQVEEPFAEITLLTDVRYFEWQVLDGRSLEWQYDWEIQGRLPLQMELIMAIGANGEEIRKVFWVPPIQNPEVVMRSLGRGGQAESQPDPNSESSPDPAPNPQPDILPQ